MSKKQKASTTEMCINFGSAQTKKEPRVVKGVSN